MAQQGKASVTWGEWFGAYENAQTAALWQNTKLGKFTGEIGYNWLI